MVPLRCITAAFVLSGVAMSPASAVGAECKIPPIEGRLTGKYALSSLADCPALEWTLEVTAADPERRHADLSVTAVGARMRLAADMDAAGDAGTWKIVEGEFDAAKWFPIFARQLGSLATRLTAGGGLGLTGGGAIAGGRPSGVVKLVWQDGNVRNAADGWSLEGISLQGEFAVDGERAAFGSAGPFEFTVRTVTTPRFGARNILIRAQLDEHFNLSIATARVEVAGGELTIDPCVIPLVPPALDLNLRINRVGLQDIAAVVPAGLSDARGRIDGELRASWSAAAGFQLGVGHLALRDDEPAMVRLASSPGFLTDHVPERIALLPAWAGALGRRLAPLNPAYPEIRRIELGLADLQVRSLVVQLTPEGDERGRSAHVQVTAAPAQAGATVKEVTFEVNVAGPLAALLRFGMNQPVSVRAR